MTSPIDCALYEGAKFPLKSWDLWKVEGSDAELFLQGQLTSDIKSLQLGTGAPSARLERTGKLVGLLYVVRPHAGGYLLLIPKEISKAIVEDLEKYVIMEEVTFSKVEGESFIAMGPDAVISDVKNEALLFWGQESRLLWGADACEIYQSLDLYESCEEELEGLQILSGFPRWEVEARAGQLVNETFLNEIAVSYKKGCFLGQETAAKIETRRGAARYPVLLEAQEGVDLPPGADLFVAERKLGSFLSQTCFEDKCFLQIALAREERIAGKELKLSSEGQLIEGKVHYLPYFPLWGKEPLARRLYDKGLEIFRTDEERALPYLERAVKLDPAFADAYESLGAVLGRVGRFEEAITWMDRLLEVQPESVMAHTNKSLYLMKLGKIEEAEEEKALATVAQFNEHGRQAEAEKAKKEALQKEEAEIKRREGMFLQVLEIDPDDTLANYGMADIYFQRGDFQQSEGHLKKVLLSDDKYSVGYLLLGKVQESLGKKDDARATYEKGIVIASKKGDLMPANEMQSRLSKLQRE